jgi:ParB family chromosome partitioning protein
MARKISFDAPPPEDEVSPSVRNVPSAAQMIRPLLGLQPSPRPSGALGAITKSLDGLTEKAKRAEEIEQKLVAGQAIVELNPDDIDPSPVPDRMEATEEQEAGFRDMIRQRGQDSPILVRPHPSRPNRYEVAFGHKRWRAAKGLGIPVRAVVRPLTDEQLVIAQGQENSGRSDLSYIERARFAAKLEERGYPREVIMSALNIDKAALSKLIAIATRIPLEIIEAVGPAPSFGRQRWGELAELIEKKEGRRNAVQIATAADFKVLDSDKRFLKLYDGLRTKITRARAEFWNASDGTRAAQISWNGKRMTLAFDDRIAPEFGDFVRSRLQDLYDEYKQEKR